ncbi:cyclin-domain-containing protein [Macrolepiota fuliginosa MF-IS2]|uniref:Cyclin-domain-containing protein n=1 Tax=Macrolepiota fuliginosa MF-IS2 TaxID=1400762 RepID=A0A9P6C219_9AGAR|nr:cyclin-domain-containing protein [Macrolepiota fuliginosa MF-IS2]
MESSSSDRVELPTTFEDITIDHLVELIADMLQRLMTHNDKIPLHPENLTRFHSRSVPNISVLDYLKRIVRFTNVEKACFLLTLNYIDQITARMPNFIFTSLTCHRFIIAAITASSKGLCDAFCTNQLYAKVGGITVTELNSLEREFLSAIDWRLMSVLIYQCTRDVLNEYYTSLVRTNSTGRYVLAGDTSQNSQSGSDSDIDMDSGQSRDASPEFSTSPTRRRSTEASTILIDPGAHVPPSEGIPRATLEQSIAFAELQQSQSQSQPQPQSQSQYPN